MCGFAADYMEFASYAAGTVKFPTLTQGRVRSVHCNLVCGWYCGFALSVTFGAGVSRCDCPRQSLPFGFASLLPEWEP